MSTVTDDMPPSDEALQILVEAIQSQRRIRLVYTRQSDEVTTIHEVAPLDIRPGWTERIRNKVYLWAWCFAEGKAEMHLLTRIKSVALLESGFNATAIIAQWTETAWPLPDQWEIPRDW